MIKYLSIFYDVQLPITNYQLPITNYQLPITYYLLIIIFLTANCQLISVAWHKYFSDAS